MSGQHGPLIAAELGMSGASLGIGYGRKSVLNIFGGWGATASASVLRTWNDPAEAEPDTTYYGIEGTVTFMIFVGKIGAYTSGDDDLMSLSLGIGF